MKISRVPKKGKKKNIQTEIVIHYLDKNYLLKLKHDRNTGISRQVT